MKSKCNLTKVKVFLFFFYLFSFHPSLSKQTAALQSPGVLLEVSSLWGVFVLWATATSCLLWRDQMVFSLIGQRAREAFGCDWTLLK